MANVNVINSNCGSTNCDGHVFLPATVTGGSIKAVVSSILDQLLHASRLERDTQFSRPAPIEKLQSCVVVVNSKRLR